MDGAAAKKQSGFKTQPPVAKKEETSGILLS